MSWPYLHTLVNHFPIVLTVVGALTIFLGLLIPRRGIWLYGLASLTLAGLLIYPAWLSGDKAGDMLHDAWYIQPGAIHRHSQAADITVWIVIVAGVLSLIAWLTVARMNEAVSPARWLRAVLGIVALVALCAVAYTGYLGGKIVVESPILGYPAAPAIPGVVQPAVVGGPPVTVTPNASTAQPAPTSPAIPTQPPPVPKP